MNLLSNRAVVRTARGGCVALVAWALMTPRVSAQTSTSTFTADAPADHERARARRARGEFVALETIMADAEKQGSGRIINVELEGMRYEIELLRVDGVLVELEYDAKTGRLLDIEIDD